jgi:ABC-2 type transport system ATP-binding protein
MTADEPAIWVEQLTKRYRDTLAVDRVSFQVARGEFFGFLGQNGAGKTTTIKMLCGLLKPTSGRMRVAGHEVATDPLGVKAHIGILPDTVETFDRLTGTELVTFAGLMYGLPEAEVRRRAAVLFDLVDLDPMDREKLVIDYSMGMRKKAALACALIHGPDVLFLDEPFNGIDAITTQAIQRVLQSLAAKGATIFFTSHTLEVVEKLCTRVAIIDRGQLRAMGTVAELARQVGVEGASLGELYAKALGKAAKVGDIDWVKGSPGAPLQTKVQEPPPAPEPPAA